MRRVAGAMNRIGCRTVALFCYRHRTWRISPAKRNRWPGATVAAKGNNPKPGNRGRCRVRASRRIQTDAEHVAVGSTWRTRPGAHHHR